MKKIKKTRKVPIICDKQNKVWIVPPGVKKIQEKTHGSFSKINKG